MKVHELKLQKEFCDEVFCSIKLFEIRYNDRDYKVGDYIRFVPIDNEIVFNHPISKALYKITYITSAYCRDGYVTFSIVRCV